ncbi:hypothetical protein [Microbispora sp. ATCC PTA-5024]|nr:hypothetical protein [Microbispora sp. ATCC PTA-5024]ETK33499.1 hypothetical protein MPTA5024_24260 [Microbispora sp. ATCC PTA-5024]
MATLFLGTRLTSGAGPTALTYGWGALAVAVTGAAAWLVLLRPLAERS